MRVGIITLLIAAVAVSFGCQKAEQKATAVKPTPSPVPVVETASTPLPKLVLKHDEALEAEIARIAAGAKGKVGVAAIAIDSGEAAFVNGDQHFPMQSVYKLPISMAVMEQVRLGKIDPDAPVAVKKEDMVREGMRSPLRDQNPEGGQFSVRDLVRFALVESDGTASDVLMRVAGGAGEIQAFLTRLNVNDMKVVNTEKELGSDWDTQYANYATPAAAAELLRHVDPCVTATGDDPRSCRIPGPYVMKPFDPMFNDKLVYRSMAESIPGAMRLKRLLPKGTEVAHKTGTGGTKDGVTGATNDIGIIRLPDGKHIAIAVFVADSSADERTREAVIAKIGRAVWDKWAKG